MSIFYAFLSALLVGTSDFLGRLNSQNIRPLYNVLLVMGIGTICLYGVMDIQGYGGFSDFSKHHYLLGALGGVINFGAVLCLYTGLRRGPVAVVSPLSSLSTLFLAFEWFLYGFDYNLIGLIGILLSVVGAVFVGYEKNNPLAARHQLVWITALLGLGAAVCFATRTFIVQSYMTDLHVVESFFLIRFFAFCSAFLWIGLTEYKNIIGKIDLSQFKIKNFFPVVMQSLLETFGILLLMYVATGAYRVIAPAVFSFFCVFTILWAVIFLKEHLHIHRMIGIAILISGVILMQVSL